ncbi:hypothetical protein [Streptomyces sp. Rer75]|uniref:hypothetical protein n=1 Tax=unclassified Streptomyces TaxID=2593676 RepID=UPI0015CF8790|nr:hypothetical protein [Streptomyces sp. Rer75]QLH21471.1 hypothetical protein HYQ63_13265 [Streptomyces sp. Rer75]
MSSSHDGEGALTRARPENLDPGAVIAQSLDNQWVSADLTRKMIAKGKSLRDIQDLRNDQVRAEYFRSLINTRQVVVNRVFFYNNPAVSRDLVDGGEARRAHQKLLADSSLVPFLLREREPTDRPQGVDLDEDAFDAWRETLAEMPATEKVTCVRLSWNDQENARDSRSALINPFAARVQGLTAKDLPLLASQVGVPNDKVPAFVERVGEVVEFSNRQRIRDAAVTRNLLYEKFVCVDGSPVSDGRYDGSKPFSAEVKHLLDLIYNVNLADALGMYPLTPTGSLRRVALQEWRDVRVASAGATVRDPEQLVKFLQRQAFSTVQDRLTPSEIDTLALEDIWSLRQSGPWHRYMEAFSSLTADPAAFHANVGDVFDRYVRLNSEIVRLVEARRGSKAEANKWSPVLEVVLTVGGAVFTALTGAEGWSVAASLGATSVGSFGGSVQMVLRNRAAGQREQKFAREIASVRLDSEREWNEFRDLARRLPGYTEDRAAPSATSSTTIQENDDVLEY